MTTRRQFLRGGLGALTLGLTSREGLALSSLLRLPSNHPFLDLPTKPASLVAGGLPFAPWFTGDSFENSAIPFHQGKIIEPPAPEEQIDVAVVGGGISGLATAYLLREHKPVVFELRDRFGGNSSGEVWRGVRFSLGGAYIIVPDEGSFLEGLYRDLGLDRAARVSLPPDPIELGGRIRDDFWKGAGLPPEERLAFERYAQVVRTMAEETYPEIPLPEDPVEAAWVRDLDRLTFREDVEQRMGLPMPGLLAAAVQGYFYSSFGVGMQDVSAASGWNFVAAEEYGRWVFPGGNAYLARALWNQLSHRPHHLRSRSRVVDVRRFGARVQVTYLDAQGILRSLVARHVVMAGSKHICKYVLHDLAHWDPDRFDAMNHIDTSAYVVANVLLASPIDRDFYDVFLIGDERFPMDDGSFEARSQVVDVIRGDYAGARDARYSVLTLFWPLPWPSARFTLLQGEPFQSYAESIAPQIREILALLQVPDSAVRQVRLTRWGHAMPVARPYLIAKGVVDRVRSTLDGNIHFVNQDNWALPAVENSLLDARTTAAAIAADLGGARGVRRRIFSGV